MKPFQRLQYQLTEHIRQPEQNPPPQGVEERRLKIYRELFFNNVQGFINSAFPVLRSLYSETCWLALIRDFFAGHNCRSPLFLDISREFVDFLSEEYQLQSDDPPFIRELAHYEWVELAVAVAPDEAESALFDGAPKSSDPLVVADTAMVVSYAYRVHQIRVDNQPEQASPQATFLIVYRDREEQVRFMDINPMTAQLMVLLQAEPGRSVDDLLLSLHSLAPQFAPDVLADGALQIVTMLAERGIVRSNVASQGL